MKLSGAEVATIEHRQIRNRERFNGKTVTGVSTDSRTVRPGDLFVAIRGERVDGHAFLRDAFAKGAVAAVVSEDPTAEAGWPILVVDDTVKALGELARMHRRRFSLPVLAIAGSNGKTTTKEMIRQVLEERYRVLSTEGNHNNQIGVPETLFRLENAHEVAVVELGTNHPGELGDLCAVVEPTHGLVTGIGREHLEFFRTLQGVAKEEGTLYDALAVRKDGVAFVNADDLRVAARARRVRRRISYGMTARGVGIRGTILGVDEQGCARLRCVYRKSGQGVEIELRVPGIHHAGNALAAATVGFAFSVPGRKIKERLERFRAVGKRMEVLSVGGVTIFNDTYNANPDSMAAALQTLAVARVSGKRIAVLGDMLELGAVSAREHTRLGREAARIKLDYLLTIGEETKRTHAAAGKGFAVHYDQKNVLAEYLAELVAPGDAVLVKGSRGMGMEDIVTFLTERLGAAAARHTDITVH